LHERGWRARTGPAPLRETLAAAVLRLSGWDRATPLVDPMCGGGTLAIEAAAWSRGMAPGLSRAELGFERWASTDASLRTRLRDLRERARAAARPEGPPIVASDVDPAALEWTRDNARAAGVQVVTRRADVRDLAPLGPSGFVVTNPPYGERIDADRTLYGNMARALRALSGHTAAILAGTPAIGQAMGRPPDRWWMLFNGPIECRLLVYAR
jgi:putative N6-adenine-specific DNA methylase